MPASGQADHLVRLQRQPPARPLHRQLDRRVERRLARRRSPSAGPGNGAKSQPSSSAGSIPGCGQTSFSSSPLRWTTSVPALGLTHSQSMPGDAGKRAVALDRDPEAARVERIDQRRVELQHRLAAGDHDQPRSSPPPHSAATCRRAPRHRRTCRRPRRPCRRNRCRRNCTAPSRGPARAPTTVAAGKAQEHRAAARLHALALQGQEAFLDRVGSWRPRLA